MKSVLITGASSGIGEALALAYANLNWRVIACGRNQERLNALSQKHINIDTRAFDITDTQEVNLIAEQSPNVDVAIFNAGDCEYIDNVMQFDGQLFERVIKTNLVSMGYLLSAWTSKINAGGSIAFVSSSVTTLPLSRAQAYGASKAGLDYLAKSFAVDAKAHNIHVSLVAPGFVATPLTDKNKFSMPFIVSPENAASRIISGINKKKHTIYFPKRFIYLMKLFSLLPTNLWLTLSQRLK